MRAHSGVQPPGRLACGILTAAAVDGGGRRCAEWRGVGGGVGRVCWRRTKVAGNGEACWTAPWWRVLSGAGNERGRARSAVCQPRPAPRRRRRRTTIFADRSPTPLKGHCEPALATPARRGRLGVEAQSKGHGVLMPSGLDSTRGPGRAPRPGPHTSARCPRASTAQMMGAGLSRRRGPGAPARVTAARHDPRPTSRAETPARHPSAGRGRGLPSSGLAQRLPQMHRPGLRGPAPPLGSAHGPGGSPCCPAVRPGQVAPGPAEEGPEGRAGLEGAGEAASRRWRREPWEAASLAYPSRPSESPVRADPCRPSESSIRVAHPCRPFESSSEVLSKPSREYATAAVLYHMIRVVRIAPNRAAAPRDSRFGQNERLGDSAIR